LTPAEPFRIGGVQVAPGRRQRVEIPVARLVTQTWMHLPVIVHHGFEPGPRLWLSGALHGDELNGVEIVHRVLDALKGATVRGTVVGVPIVNLFGFLHQSRYLPDRRDLNRCFPGSATGSLASQLARLFVTEVVERCTHGIDFHTGSNQRTNHPQVRADLGDEELLRLAQAFGAPFTVHARKVPGTLREAAMQRGIPCLLFEGGECLRFAEDVIVAGVAGTLRVMRALGMVEDAPPVDQPPLVIGRNRWLRAGRSGILNMRVGVGERIGKGRVLATIRDPYGDRGGRLVAQETGFVIGHTLNPLVHRGDAVLNLGLAGIASKEQP
jgi:predicted deacylase